MSLLTTGLRVHRGRTIHAFGLAVAMAAVACDYTPNGPAIPSPSPLQSPSGSIPVFTVPISPIGSCAGMADYCGGSCPTYSEDVAALRQACANRGRLSASRYATIHCPGEFYATERVEDSGLRWRVEYFDGNGVMIGARAGSPTKDFCGGKAADLRVGTILTCPLEKEQRDVLC